MIKVLVSWKKMNQLLADCGLYDIKKPEMLLTQQGFTEKLENHYKFKVDSYDVSLGTNDGFAWVVLFENENDATAFILKYL
ncbi:MAG: hypothetical protein ACHQII_04760 [Bacteroidia bacterium]